MGVSTGRFGFPGFVHLARLSGGDTYIGVVSAAGESLFCKKMVGHLKGVTKRVEQGKRRDEALVVRCLQARRIG